MKGLLNRQHFYAGQSVFHEGETGYKMYIVESGSVSIWSGTPEERVEIALITKGGVFGEMAVFDGRPRMASASAAEPTTLLLIDGKHLREAITRTDPIVDKMMRVVLDSARDLGQQLHRARLRNAELEQKLRALTGDAADAVKADTPESERG